MERLPPPKPGGDQDALLQTPGRAGDGQNVGASGCGVACAGGFTQPFHATGAPDYGACVGACYGVAASGVGAILA